MVVGELEAEGPGLEVTIAVDVAEVEGLGLDVAVVVGEFGSESFTGCNGQPVISSRRWLPITARGPRQKRAACW